METLYERRSIGILTTADAMCVICGVPRVPSLAVASAYRLDLFR